MLFGVTALLSSLLPCQFYMYLVRSLRLMTSTISLGVRVSNEQ